MAKHCIISMFFLCNFLVFSQQNEIKTDSLLKAEQSSTFKACYELDIIHKKKCYLNEIKQHIIKSFGTDFATKLKTAPDKSDLNLAFRITSNGTIVDIKSRADNKFIEEEAPKYLKLLPEAAYNDSFNSIYGAYYTLPMTLTLTGK